MLTNIFDAIVARLNGDATLMSLLGKNPGDNPCYRAQRLSAITAPSVTLHENTENSALFPGTDITIEETIPSSFIATNTVTIQIDIWVSSQAGTPSTGRDADAIANRIDVLLFQNTPNWIQYTHGWRRGSSSQQYEEATSLWHNALRYSFEYHIMTGFVAG